jgi:hypothetical protein
MYANEETPTIPLDAVSGNANDQITTHQVEETKSTVSVDSLSFSDINHKRKLVLSEMLHDILQPNISLLQNAEIFPKSASEVMGDTLQENQFD